MQNQHIEGEVCALQRIDANASPFYLLATVFGEPERQDEVTRSRNRRAWNRFYARLFAASEREALIERGVPADDLRPYSQEEENKLAAAFAARQGPGFRVALPAADALIDFQNIRFENTAGFEGYIFSHAAFSRAQFTSPANFNKAVFLKESHFEGTEFAGETLFDACLFEGPAQFQTATIAGTASWKKAVFNGTAQFDDAKFNGECSFEEARFALWAAFRNTQFAAAHFGSARFAGGTTFELAEFAGAARFSHACFADWLSFQDANFHSSSIFSNAEMRNKTIFDGMTFLTQPPEFSGAKMLPGTGWDKINWPKPKGRDKAKKFVISHERLMRQVNRLEQRAAAIEDLGKKMQSRPVLQGRMLGLPAALMSLVTNSSRHPI